MCVEKGRDASLSVVRQRSKLYSNKNIGMTETQQRHHGQHQSPLTPRQVDVYLRDGILVVDDLLSHEEVAEARLGLASTILDEFGVDVRDLEGTGRNLADASSTNGAGKFLSLVHWIGDVGCAARMMDGGWRMWLTALTLDFPTFLTYHAISPRTIVRRIESNETMFCVKQEGFWTSSIQSGR